MDRKNHGKLQYLVIGASGENRGLTVTSQRSPHELRSSRCVIVLHTSSQGGSMLSQPGTPVDKNRQQAETGLIFSTRQALSASNVVFTSGLFARKVSEHGPADGF